MCGLDVDGSVAYGDDVGGVEFVALYEYLIHLGIGFAGETVWCTH